LVLRVAKLNNHNSLSNVFLQQIPRNSNIKENYFKKLKSIGKTLKSMDDKFLQKTLKDQEKIDEIKNKIIKEAGHVGVKFLIKTLATQTGINEINIAEEDLKKLVEHSFDVSYNSFDRVFNTQKYRLENFLPKEIALAFLTDIDKILDNKKLNKKELLIIMDDFEAFQDGIQEVFLRHIIGQLKAKNYNSTLIFIGRDELDWIEKWRVHQDSKKPSIHLKVFSIEEAQNYLQKKGIDNEKDIKSIIKDSQRLPLLLDILSNAKLEGVEVKWIEDYYRRITHHMNKEQKEWLEKISFLDVRVDIDTITTLLNGDSDEAERAFSWFKKEGTAYTTSSEGWFVDSIVKSLVKKKVNQESLLKSKKYTDSAKKSKIRYDNLKNEFKE
jgi:hypothetical protein